MMTPARTVLLALCLLGAAAGSSAYDEYDPPYDVDPYASYGGDDGYESYGDYPPYGYGDGYGDEGGFGAPPCTKVFGVVELDDSTFEKVAFSPKYSTLVLVYGNNEWESLVAMLHELETSLRGHMSLLIAQLDNIHEDVLARYDIPFDSPPSFYLFSEELDNPIKYEGDSLDNEGLIAFVAKHVGGAYEVKVLKTLLEAFQSEPDTAAREAVIGSVEQKLATLSSAEQKIGAWYVKVMKKVMDKGPEYVEKEFNRLGSILTEQKHSLKPEKFDEFQLRREVLKAFDSSLKDEL